MKLKTLLAASTLALLLAPSLSFADTTSVTITDHQQLIQQLTSELAALQAQLKAALAQQATTVSISPNTTGYFDLGTPFALASSQHIDETQTGNQGGVRITFMGFQRITTPNKLASTSPLTGPFGSFLLNYNVCGGTYCTNSNYPTQTTQLWPGQSTNYMNETIMLNGLSSNAALLTVTPQSKQ